MTEVVVTEQKRESGKAVTDRGKPARATKTSSPPSLLSLAINFSRAGNFAPVSDLQHTDDRQ